MARRQLQVTDLITTRVSLDEAPQFYSELGENKGELGILIQYPQASQTHQKSIQLPTSQMASSSNAPDIAVLGAGQFAGAVLLPLFSKQGFRFSYLGSRSGPLGPHLAKKYGFSSLTSDYSTVLDDPKIHNVLVATRHSSHGSLVLSALKQGKNTFVEKPLALTETEIDEIESFYSQGSGPKPLLMVGFNRRFSPLVQELKKSLANVGSSKAFVMTVNAGAIPKKHWTQDPQVGGGRLLGEGCHFIDLLRYLSGSPIAHASATAMSDICPDTFSIQLHFENGDIGTIHYFSNGSKSFPKERLEVFVGGKIVVLDNFKTLKGIGLKRFKYILKSQDKGHSNEVHQFKTSIANGQPPIPLEEIFEVSRWAIKLQNEINQS
jgi:predicted dehydrogenase